MVFFSGNSKVYKQTRNLPCFLCLTFSFFFISFSHSTRYFLYKRRVARASSTESCSPSWMAAPNSLFSRYCSLWGSHLFYPWTESSKSNFKFTHKRAVVGSVSNQSSRMVHHERIEIVTNRVSNYNSVLHQTIRSILCLRNKRKTQNTSLRVTTLSPCRSSGRIPDHWVR